MRIINEVLSDNILRTGKPPRIPDKAHVYASTNNETKDYGILYKDDIVALLKGYSYYPELEMWFKPDQKRASQGIWLKPVSRFDKNPVKEASVSAPFEMDAENDDHRGWRYKGHKVLWNKHRQVWDIYTKDGDPDWEAESRAEAKSWVDNL